MNCLPGRITSRLRPTVAEPAALPRFCSPPESALLPGLFGHLAHIHNTLSLAHPCFLLPRRRSPRGTWYGILYSEDAYYGPTEGYPEGGMAREDVSEQGWCSVPRSPGQPSLPLPPGPPHGASALLAPASGSA